jgi:hypothetical protein
MSDAVASGLAAASALQPGHGNITASAALRPDWLGAQVGYEHHLEQRGVTDLALFATAVAGMRSSTHGWQPDVGAVGGIKFSW